MVSSTVYRWLSGGRGLIGIIVISDIGISVGIENYVASSFIASHI